MTVVNLSKSVSGNFSAGADVAADAANAVPAKARVIDAIANLIGGLIFVCHLCWVDKFIITPVSNSC